MIEENSSPNPVKILPGITLLVGISLTSAFSYLLFHSLVEIFSVVVACGIFIITWHTRRLIDNNYFLFLGIGFLFVGLISLLHTLAYKNMGVFPNQGANLPTQLWIATCFVQILSFTIAPLFINRKVNVGQAFAGFSAVTVILLTSIFVWDIFPDCFLEGSGLTAFKKSSEYLVALLLIACFVSMRKKREHFASEVYRFLAASLVFLILAELAFTLYTDVFGITNKLGHILKLVGFFFVYKAIIAAVSGLKGKQTRARPFSLRWEVDVACHPIPQYMGANLHKNSVQGVSRRKLSALPSTSDRYSMRRRFSPFCVIPRHRSLPATALPLHARAVHASSKVFLL